jgi:hypothetical protein
MQLTCYLLLSYESTYVPTVGISTAARKDKNTFA